MKSKYLASAALCIAAAMGFMACGDDVITVYGDEVYSIVDEIDDSTCTKANDGKMSLEKKSGTLFLCDDGKWTPVNGSEVVDLRCKSSLLKDSTGYNIICDGDTIATIYNGQNGKGSKGSNGLSAYELAKENGLVDTTKIKSEKEWLESLQGENGKDILEQLQEKNLLPDSIQTIEDLLKYLKGENGSAGSNGLSAYELAKANGLVDTTKIKSEKEWLESLQGENGKDLLEQLLEKKLIPDTVTTVAKLLEYLQGKDADEKAITEKLEESLSCKVLTEEDIDPEDEGEPLYLHPDEKLGIMIVPVKCGKNVSTLELPMYVKDYALLENLAKHYKKHVVVRIPFIDINDGVVENDISGYDYFENVWKNLQSSGVAELTVMEMNSSEFSLTGKNFISNLVASDLKSYVVSDKENKSEFGYKVAYLEGDIDVSNLIDTVAQFRVSLNLKNEMSMTSQITFNAVVNLKDETETVVVDFLTDYKAARVMELMKKEGANLATVAKTANKELADALSLEVGEDAFETYLPSESDVKENQNMLLWPAVLIKGDMEGTVSANTVYAKYREAFAKDGNLDADISGSVDGVEYQSIFYVDYIGLILGIDELPTCGSSFEQNPGLFLKSIQESLTDDYGLPECNSKNVGVTQSEIGMTKGAFEYFVCDEDNTYKDLWAPITDKNIDKYFDEIASAILNKKCTSEYKDLVKYFTFNNETYAAMCSERGVWGRKILTDCTVGEVVDLGGSTPYHLCVEDENGNKELEYIGDDGFDLLKKYNELCPDNEGKIYPIYGIYYDNQQRFAICETPTSSESSSSNFRVLYPENSENDFNLLANDQAGECNATNNNKIESIQLYPRSSYQKVVCSEGNWTLLNGSADPISLYDVCTEEKMKEDKVYRVDVLGQQKSTLTGYKYYKCDCEYEEVACRGSCPPPALKSCSWKSASKLEIQLDKACNYNNIWDFSEDGKYRCKLQYGNHGWSDNFDEDDRTDFALQWCTDNKGWRFLNGETSIIELKPDEESTSLNGTGIPGEETSGPYALCDNLPNDMTTYMLGYSLSGSSVTSVGTDNADHYFDYPCEQNSKYISDKLYDYTYTKDDKHVHDFICKTDNKGNVRLREAVDEQEACDSAFARTDICKYMKEAYRFDATDGLWKKITAEEYCNEQLNNAYDGLQSCSTSEVNAFCSIEGNSGDGDAPCPNGEFWYQCTLPEALQDDGVYMDCQKEEDTYKWSSHGA